LAQRKTRRREPVASPLLVRMHPMIRRDLARLGQLDDVYGRRVAALPASMRNAQGKAIGPKPRPRGENVVDLMDALKKSIASADTAQPAKGKKPRKAAAGQKEMLLPVSRKRPGAETKKADKPAATRGRKRA
jgi:hypothetical protein